MKKTRIVVVCDNCGTVTSASNTRSTADPNVPGLTITGAVLVTEDGAAKLQAEIFYCQKCLAGKPKGRLLSMKSMVDNARWQRYTKFGSRRSTAVELETADADTKTTE